MIYGYARVSSKWQLSKGNSLEEQYSVLTANGCTEIISEQYTGKTTDRPNSMRLLKNYKKEILLWLPNWTEWQEA